MPGDTLIIDESRLPQLEAGDRDARR